MTETPDIVYGRLLESAHISGYSFERSCSSLEWLLDEDRWMQIGFDDIHTFMGSIDASAFNWDQKKRLAERLAQLGARQTDSAQMLGTTQGTISKWTGTRRTNDDPDVSETIIPENNDEPPKVQDSHLEQEEQLDVSETIIPENNDEPPKSTRELLAQSDENEWYTPRRFIEAATTVLGTIDLDPASSKIANQIVGAERFYTIEDDGLTQPWKGTVWLNPPYGGQNRLFVERLIREYEAGNVSAGLLLVNCHPAETAWFQRLFEYTVCFVRGRIDFTGPARDRASTSTHGSAIAYLGPDWLTFTKLFSRFGSVVRRVQHP